jgi:hypothetical protein
LDAEADTGDAGFAEEGGFFGAEGGGVCLEGPFLDVGEVDTFGEFAEEKIQLFDAEGGGGSAAEVEGFWGEGVLGGG